MTNDNGSVELISPCGGTLVNLVTSAETHGKLMAEAHQRSIVQISDRNLLGSRIKHGVDKQLLQLLLTKEAGPTEWLQ